MFIFSFVTLKMFVFLRHEQCEIPVYAVANTYTHTSDTCAKAAILVRINIRRVALLTSGRPDRSRDSRHVEFFAHSAVANTTTSTTTVMVIILKFIF